LGLDAVEIILRTEEVFAVNLPDEECSLVVTVGDLYRLVLNQLSLPYQPSVEIEHGCDAWQTGCRRLRSQLPSIYPWTATDTWLTLKAVIQDQLQVDEGRIREEARFVQDLGCD